MNFCMITSNQNITKKQNYVIWIKIVSLFTKYIYEDIAKYVEEKFYTANYESESTLPNEKKQESSRLNERWIRWKIMKEFVGLKVKIHSSLTDDSDERKQTV